MTQSEYRSDPAISRSELNILRELTPLHFKYAMEHKEDAESLAVALESALRLSPEETTARAKRTRAFVLGKTARAQGRKILDFLVK